MTSMVIPGLASPHSLGSRFPLSGGSLSIPAVALGTWKMSPEEAERATVWALRAGYVHVDTAAVYRNEAGVGAGIRASGIGRDSLFITTKLAPMHQGYEPALQAFDASLKKLGLDYVDMYLMHWPGTSGLPPGAPEHRPNRLASWKAMEKV